MCIVLDTTELRAALSSNVRRLRKGRGWTQAKLAELAGTTPLTISMIERALTSPGPKILFALADLFGVSTDSLRATCVVGRPPDENSSAA